MNSRNKENIKLSFGPLKIESSNLGNKTLLVIISVLLFLIAIAFTAPKLFISSFNAVNDSANIAKSFIRCLK